MGVKLLDKSKLNELKAKERDVEVREGMKIATRIDGLRELFSKTQEELEKHKAATLVQIGREVSVLDAKKEELLGKIGHLQSKYDALLPEMTMKRTELAQFEKSLKGWEKKLEKREESARLMELDVMEALQKTEDSRIRTEDDERIARNLLKEATDNRSESQNTLERARNIEEKVYKDKKEIKESLNLRELSIRANEKDLLEKELLIMKERKEFEKEKVKVNDMRATLERSLERLKAGRRA